MEASIKDDSEILSISDVKILENIGEGILIIDDRFRITYFNQKAASLTGVSPEEAVGKHCYEILRLSNCVEGCPAQKMIEVGESIVDYRSFLRRPGQAAIPVEIRFSILRNRHNNRFSGGIITLRDLPSKYKDMEDGHQLYSFQGIYSKNKHMLEIFEILPDLGRSDASVLIQGESGTGKELFASAIHNLSYRKNNPFIIVNCAALPENLLESELFGYVKGAFTDARQNKPGRFQLAHKGSIFLDEVGDIPLSIQAKLLRVVEEKEFTPLGGTDVVKVDVRIISATNRDLEQMVAAGTFRRDLYYRLNVVKLEIPPLRDRPEDISILIEHFINQFNKKNYRNIEGVSTSYLEVLKKYDFPGNVRELENIIEHAFVMCRGNKIRRDHLPSYLLRQSGKKKSPIKSIEHIFNKMEKETILKVLEKHRGNRSAAANELGMHRTTLWRKLRRMGI
jgi:PAS domain S-box-containing protein